MEANNNKAAEIVAKINAHLAAKKTNVVMISTCTNHTIYTSKHSGFFFAKDGIGFIKSGRSAVRFIENGLLLVGVQFGAR